MLSYHFKCFQVCLSGRGRISCLVLSRLYVGAWSRFPLHYWHPIRPKAKRICAPGTVYQIILVRDNNRVVPTFPNCCSGVGVEGAGRCKKLTAVIQLLALINFRRTSLNRFSVISDADTTCCGTAFAYKLAW